LTEVARDQAANEREQQLTIHEQQRAGDERVRASTSGSPLQTLGDLRERFREKLRRT
jgi:hypothetical protein